MTFTLSDQLICFCCSVLCGLGVGFFYEFLRLLRAVNSRNRVVVFCCDVVFMLVFALVTVLFSICYSRGNTRYFVVLGELAGILTIRFTLGKLSVRFLEPALRKIRHKSRKFAVNMVKLAKKLLQVITNILYNNIRKKDPVSDYRHTHKLKERGKRYHGVKTAEE